MLAGKSHKCTSPVSLGTFFIHICKTNKYINVCVAQIPYPKIYFVSQICLYSQANSLNIMTGADKKMNYPKIYHLRIDKKTFDKLFKIGSKKIRKVLEDLKIE